MLAEQILPPPVQLKELLASYPKLNEENPSSWFVWSDNPEIKPKSSTAYICHAEMRNAYAGYDYLVTAVPKADALSLSYLRMLIHGPFKAFSDLISLVRINKDQYYLQCSNLKRWPAPVLYNFCIASRTPIEFPGQLAAWEQLKAEGYPEVLSFLLSHSAGGGKFKYARMFPQHGHYWFDPASDWKNIIGGRVDVSGPSYHELPGAVTPSNQIWGKADDYIVIKSLDDEKAAEHFGFKRPPKKPERRREDPQLEKYKKIYWAPNGLPQLEPGAVQAHMNNLVQQIQADQAVAQNGWNNAEWNPQPPQPVHPAINVIHDEGEIHDYFDDFPDFHDEDDDD